VDRDLLLHVGDSKTGTSSIQEVLYHGRWRCPDVRLAYPDELNALVLARAFRTGRPPQRQATLLQDTAAWVERTDADRHLISAEQFEGVSPTALESALRTWLPRHAGAAEVIAYARPHPGRLLATFAQQVKTGAFDGDLAAFLEATATNRMMWYADRFTAWSDAFPGRFTLRHFDPAALRDGDVVTDLLHWALGGAPFEVTDPPRTNPSLTLGGMLCFREVQRRLTAAGVEPGTRHAVGNALNRRLEGSPAQAVGERVRLSRGLAEALHARHREDAAAMDDRFFAATPFTDALARAVEGATSEEQSFSLADHVDADAIADLHRAGDALADLLAEHGRAWARRFRVSIGWRTPRPRLARRGPDTGPVDDAVERVFRSLESALLARG